MTDKAKGKVTALDSLIAYISAHGGEIPRDPNALVYFSRTRNDVQKVSYKDAQKIINLYQKNLKKYRAGKVKYNNNNGKSRRISFPPRLQTNMKFRKREESQKRPKSARHSESGNNVTTTLTAPISPYSGTQNNINIGFNNKQISNDDDDNKYNDKEPYKFLTRSTSNSPRTKSPKSYKTRDINIIINDRKYPNYPNDDRSITATEIIESMASMSADDAKLDVDERVNHILGMFYMIIFAYIVSSEIILSLQLQIL